ncbi:hypothetical protein JCM10908_001822 [Rhodotorula pacifica]|uniref:uncharacterized protein n=1 Tax=Rhodotorula pacifica TaxID=1495444 RepID=UPI00317DA1BD
MPLHWQLDPYDDISSSSHSSSSASANFAFGLDDHALGAIGLLCTISSFAYYTCWTLLTPFLPSSSPLLALFPLSREWAIRLPALIILVGLSFVGMLTGFVLIETAHRNGARLTSVGGGAIREQEMEAKTAGQQSRKKGD